MRLRNIFDSVFLTGLVSNVTWKSWNNIYLSKSKTVYTADEVELQPFPKGGLSDLTIAFSKHIEDIKTSEKGDITFDFIVTELGRTEKIQLISSNKINAETGLQLLNVFKSMQVDWMPARKDSKRVKVLTSLKFDIG